MKPRSLVRAVKLSYLLDVDPTQLTQDDKEFLARNGLRSLHPTLMTVDNHASS